MIIIKREKYLSQIIDELKENGIKDDHIIYINFEDIKYDII